MSALRILAVCADPGIAPGTTKGAAVHLRGLTSGLMGLGHEVVVCSIRPPEGPFPVGVEPIGHLEAVRPGETDLVYERMSLGHRGGLATARRLGVPFVLEVDAPLVDEAMRHRPGSVAPSDPAVEAELVREADLVVVVSSALATWARARRSGPVALIHNGFEPSWFRGADPGRRPARLAFIGHPKPWHGADRLVPLVAELTSTGRSVELLVIGGGPGADAIAESAAQLDLADRVIVTGARPPRDAVHELRTASIGLAPYRRIQPFYFCPLKVVDYLAAGLAIVSSDVGDIARMTAGSAVLVDPDDDGALASAVADLLDDDDRRRALGADARRISSTMSWRHVAARTVQAIERTAERSSSAAR